MAESALPRALQSPNSHITGHAGTSAIRPHISPRSLLRPSRIWVVHAIYISQVLNPIYARMGATGSHTVWHSIYYSLQIHPDWNTKYGESHRHATGDNQPWAGAENYLTRHPIQRGDVPLNFD